MPPPSWANSATKLAPKPKPTIRNGVEPTGLPEQLAVDAEDAGDAEQRERNDQEAGDRAAAQRDGDRGAQVPLRGRGRAQVRAHGDVHADVAGDRGAGGADQEGDAGQHALLTRADRLGLGAERVLHDRRR